MSVRSGLEVLVGRNFAPLDGLAIGLVVNQASVNRNLVHALDLFQTNSVAVEKFRLATAFGPQHGIWGHTQDNMIEWEGYADPRLGVPVYSLYGKERKPTYAMLDGLDALVIDLPDIGSRYYTFLWTTFLCLEACAEAGVRVILLDRPNPIGGLRTEGPFADPAYASFVGLKPILVRHGMTLGEMALWLKATYVPGVDLEIIGVEHWERGMHADDTGLPWVLPSPNMPTVDTARVYPGMCLLEGANLSEGRGTTKPFEIFGAEWLDSWELCDWLNMKGLDSVYFRPHPFQPTFHKFAGQYCGGAQIHVLDREAFEPVLTGIAILQAARALAGDKFQWNPPPYEYEDVLLPIDILGGSPWIREAVDNQMPLKQVREKLRADAAAFEPTRREFLLY